MIQSPRRVKCVRVPDWCMSPGIGQSTHRPTHCVYLLWPGSGPFSMAFAGMPPVIYIIITRKMKAVTTHSTSVDLRSHVRAGLIIGGVIIAVIVAIFMIHDLAAQSAIGAILPDFADGRSVAAPQTFTYIDVLRSVTASIK